MTFNEGGSFEGGRVRKGGRGKGPVIVGGGIAAVLVAVLVALLNGGDLNSVLGAVGDQVQATSTEDTGQQQYVEDCTAQQANTERECRLSATSYSLDDYWTQALPAQTGVAYSLPDVVSFQASTQTACGSATSAVGPFYCPPDQTVYLDVSFFDELRDRFGATDGSLAEMYVVAHEFGHHIEQLTGAMASADRSGTGPDSDSVRIELMADCLAGMWVGEASNVVDPTTGVTYLAPISDAELADALSAASAVGDDRIQQSATGSVNPEAWTHGSSEQRQRWFMTGYEGGTYQDCDALGASSL
ncbi:KPN_02809 family neutral zinc metallopeptidase [Oerskovia turbata]